MAISVRLPRVHAKEPGRDEVPGIRVLTPEEGRDFFERRAQSELGISGEEFLRRWDAGDYRPVPDSVEGRKIGRLVMMIPFARRTNA